MHDLTPAGAPNPDDPAGSDVPPEPKKESTQSEQSRPRNAGQILDEQQCLAGLSQLPGLMTIGFLKPQTSNAIRGVYHELLQHSQRSGRDDAKPAQINEDVIAILRKNPAMLKQFEPLLTDEQFKTVLSELTGGNE
jgi:hypothetical protein